jgi:hypothetical protein
MRVAAADDQIWPVTIAQRAVLAGGSLKTSSSASGSLALRTRAAAGALAAGPAPVVGVAGARAGKVICSNTPSRLTLRRGFGSQCVAAVGGALESTIAESRRSSSTRDCQNSAPA